MKLPEAASPSHRGGDTEVQTAQCALRPPSALVIDPGLTEGTGGQRSSGQASVLSAASLTVSFPDSSPRGPARTRPDIVQAPGGPGSIWVNTVQQLLWGDEVSQKEKEITRKKFPFRLLNYLSTVRTKRGFGDRRQDTATPGARKQWVRAAWVQIPPSLTPGDA